MLLGPTLVRGVDRYPYDLPNITQAVTEQDRLLDARLEMLKPTPSYPDHKAGLGLYMVRPITKPPAQHNIPRPSAGTAETPIHPASDVIPRPDWVEALRQEDTPVGPPIRVRQMSGPPHPFITLYLVAVCEGRMALDPPEDAVFPLPPPADPQPTDSNQSMPLRQINAANLEGATERRWHHYFASPFEGRRTKRVSVLDCPMRVDLPDDGPPEERRLEPNPRHPSAVLPSPYSNPPNSNYPQREPFGPPADHLTRCPLGPPRGDPPSEGGSPNRPPLPPCRGPPDDPPPPPGAGYAAEDTPLPRGSPAPRAPPDFTANVLRRFKWENVPESLNGTGKEQRHSIGYERWSESQR